MRYSFEYELQLRIRYSETDQMGFCYYGNYPVFLELARVESLRSLNISYRELEETGILLPVKSLHIEYLRPLRYDEEFRIQTKLTSVGASSVFFEYTFFNSLNQVTTTATTTLVFVDQLSLKPRRIPQEIIQALQNYEIHE